MREQQSDDLVVVGLGRSKQRRRAGREQIVPEAVVAAAAAGLLERELRVRIHPGVEHGFDEIDRKLLRAIIERFDGGPVGVSTIAAVLSEEVDAIEDIYEPFLLQIGFLQRTPRGRVATRLAYEHLGIPYKSPPSSLF